MEAPEANGSVEHFPESIVNLLEPDVLLAQDVTDADPVRVPPDPAIARDPPDFEMTGILDLGKPTGEGSLGRTIGGCRSLLSQRLVRPLVVEEMAESVELLLLGVVVL